MKNNLVERYIYAVVRRLPEKEHAEVTRELDELISSMLSERSGDGLSEDARVKIVLTTLGKPDELARKYGSSAANCLIGEPHYSTYKRVLRIVLLAVSLALLVGLLVSWFFDTPAPIGADTKSIVLLVTERILGIISTIFNALMGVFAVITGIFAILYHKGVRIDSEALDLDDLPEIPKRDLQIGIGGLIGSFVFCAIFAVLFILLPQVNIPILIQNEPLMPFFNPAVLIQLRFLLIAMLVAIILEAVVKYRFGKYATPAFLVTLLSNGMTILTTLVWFGNPQAVNMDLVNRVKTLTGWNLLGFNGEPIGGLFGHWSILAMPLAIALVVIIIVSTIEIITSAIKTYRKPY